MPPTLIALQVEDEGVLRTLNVSDLADEGSAADVFGALIIGGRNNQVEVHLDDTNWATYVDQTTSGGGGAVQTLGAVSFSTGTGTNGRAGSLSKDTVKYRPHSEIYAGFTAAFPVAGVASSHQRIGLTDTLDFANALVVGYEAGSFGISWFRNGALESHVAQASWNVDPCLAASTSRFMRGGTPEALDPALGNLYRVSCGLFGYAGFVVQVFSPDHEWVTVHKIGRANTEANPVFANFDLKVGAQVRKTGAGASDLSIRSACWAGGTTVDKDRLSDAITDRSLAQTTRAVIEGKTPSGTYAKVTVNAQGRLQVTNDAVGTDGSAAPAGSTAVGGTDPGGLLQTLAVDTVGNLRALPLPAGAATAAMQSGRYGGGKTPVVATVTAFGPTVVYTPTLGNAVRLFWLSAINKGDADPTIKILIGSLEIYRVVAVSHWEIFEGLANESLIVDLSVIGNVEFTAHIEEFIP